MNLYKRILSYIKPYLHVLFAEQATCIFPGFSGI